MEFIHIEYVDGLKKLGNTHSEFMARIRGPLICLIFGTLQHALATYETGEIQDGDCFNHGSRLLVLPTMLRGSLGICSVDLHSPSSSISGLSSLDRTL